MYIMSSDNTLNIGSSSAISSATYNPTNQELSLDFGNKSYIYADVEQSVVDGLISADSVGNYYHTEIKGKYSTIQSVSV